MKALITFLFAIVAAQSLTAMIYVESKILSVEELKKLGVEIERLRVPDTTRDLRIRITVNPASGPGKYFGTELVIYDRNLDDDFSSRDGLKIGVRDTKRWSKIVREEDFAATSTTVVVSPSEVPCGYIAIHYGDLPPRDGIPVISGHYYFPLSEITQETHPIRQSQRRQAAYSHHDDRTPTFGPLSD